MIRIGTVAPVVTFTVLGAEQVAAKGAPEHANETLPSNPAMSCRLYIAVWPAVTAWEKLPPAAGATVSNGLAFPLSATVCGELGASSVIVNVATRAPAAPGVNVKPRVHAVFTAYEEAVHPLFNLKSAALAPLS